MSAVEDMNFMSYITGLSNAGQSPKELRGFHFALMHYRFFWLLWAWIANAFFQMSLLTSQQWSLVKKWLFSFSFLLFFALFGFLFVSTRSISRTMSFFAQTFVWKCHVAFSQKDVNLSNESTACDCTLSSGTHYASLTAKTPNIQNTRHLFTPHVSNLILFQSELCLLSTPQKQTAIEDL